MSGGFCDFASACPDEDFTQFTRLWWSSSTVKRVVRSHLIAEWCAVSGVVEHLSNPGVRLTTESD